MIPVSCVGNGTLADPAGIGAGQEEGGGGIPVFVVVKVVGVYRVRGSVKSDAEMMAISVLGETEVGRGSAV